MNNLIPEDWGEVVLGDYAHIKARIGWRGLSSSEYTETGPYLIAGTHIRGESVDWGNCHHINKFRYDESPEIQLKEMDVIISKDGTIGRLGFIENMPGPATINGTMMLIRPDDNFYSKFIYFYLQGNKFQKVVKEKVSGSSVPHIFQRDMVTLRVPFPPLPEQQKIAAILTSVDEVVEKTQAQIDKLKDLKTAMMQELLTQGIGHTEFKDSPVGRIPKGWDVGGIYDYCHEIFLGLTAKVDYTESEGVFLVRATDISKGVLSFDNARKITLAQHQSLTKKRQAKRGDVLISKSGSLGVCAVVDTDVEFSIYESIIVLQPKEGVIDSKYLLWLMRATETQTRLLGSTVGSTVGHLNLGDFRKLNIPIPTIIEQVKLGEIFDSMNERFTKIENKLQQYRSLKKALMQDLLTGKVRVKVD